MFARNKETVYGDIFIARSCSKEETLLRRISTFDFVCFLYASLSRISNVETTKRSLLQTDNFFSPQIKKETCLRTQRKILGIPRNEESNWTFLLHFVKNIFYNLQQQWFFLMSFYSFERVQYFWVELCIFFLYVALCNPPTVVLRQWRRYRTGIVKPTFTPLWTIDFSTVTYIELWWNVKDMQKNAQKN